MAASDAPEGATESGIGTRQQGLADVGRARPFGGEADRARPRTQKRNSSADLLPSVTSPKGGGAIRGIGEKFSANPVIGTGSLTIPIATTASLSGFGLHLSRSYDSGSGNGPHGFGWHLSIPSIIRRPKRGCRAISMRSILSGAEDQVSKMVPSATGSSLGENGCWKKDCYTVVLQPSWAGAAFDYDYTDQAHLVRESRTLAGLAPLNC
jgi:hypothetical protein